MSFEIKLGIINHVVILIIALSLAVAGFLLHHDKGNSVSFIEEEVEFIDDNAEWTYLSQDDMLTGFAISDVELEDAPLSSENPNKNMGLVIFAQLFALILSIGVLIIILKKRKMNGCV